MKIGCVGKPSVGKSTFFKAATLMDVDIANYPFTTIDPNSGTAHVCIECVDKEFDTQCNPRAGYCVGHKRYVPFELIDVAGLVPGAHEGRGRGLAFLSDLNEADGLIHVIDISGSVNAEGEPVDAGSYDPAEDVRFLERELDHWYFGIIKKGWDRFARRIQQEKLDLRKTLAEQLSGLKVTEDHIQSGIKALTMPEQIMDWTDEKLMEFSTYLRKQTKPMLIAANKIDRPHGKENFDRLTKEFPELTIIPCSAEIELALREAAKNGMIEYYPGQKSFTVKDESALSEKQQAGLAFMQKFLDTYGTTGVQEVMNGIVLDVLQYVAIFPGGVKGLADSEGRRLPDCFLMPPNTTALDFARKLHTDFAKHFIRAINVKTKLPIGKDSMLAHRDVVEIVSGK